MDNKAVAAIARSVRTLTIDAVQAANSGHPGMPMGMAELGALLYGEFMNHNPVDPGWANRDRFILSCGHGSMFLYSLLHLAGYDLPLEELKQFRQVGSRTPGHPEYGHTPGVETTTGPLGQGLANAVGMAIAEQMLAARFNTPEHTVVDHHTYVIVGDGCLMEGITSEASSLAGHLGLGKLIVFYDSNRISIEGSTELAFTEDVAARYRAYGWQVLPGDAYDPDQIRTLLAEAKADQRKPTLVILESEIGRGSPNKAGSHAVHGAALGDDEVAATKKAIGLDPGEMFYIDPEATAFFRTRREELTALQAEWRKTFDAWAGANPGLLAQWKEMVGGEYKDVLKDIGLPQYEKGKGVATRQASGKALQAIASMLPGVVGGSADLAPSNNTALPEYGDFTRDNRGGRTLHFGVRELAMAAIGNGMALHGGLRPFVATFLVFSDYLRPALRLSALMQVPVVYILTHDSFFVGEDGPTHQPIEHIAAMRAIPGLRVLRPADAEETGEAWLMALEHDGPTVLALTRQNLPTLEKADGEWKKAMRRGAYVVKESETEGRPELIVVATGSEVSLALEAVEAAGCDARVISMPSVELFRAQDAAYRSALLPEGVPVVTAEAGVAQGWDALAGSGDRIFSIERFGESGPGGDVAKALGFTAADLAELLRTI
ncbi:MAG: transketolase [Spirochaetaceae bacterium]|nr:MAG: transketolase [Spirochaetaceae bacterium]